MKFFVFCIVTLAVLVLIPVLAQDPGDDVVKYRPSGYYPTEETDTIRVLLVIQEPNTSLLMVVQGAAIRRKFSYFGDNESVKADDQWSMEKYFLANGKQIGSDQIWNVKILRPPAPKTNDQPEKEESNENE